jgi:quercetin 2,3-dioxygenase
VSVAGTQAKPADLAFVPPGSSRLELTAYDEPVRLLLLGGPPFGESIVMWWNIVARTHEEVVEWRARWQEQITDAGLVDGWFGIPVGDELPPIPAPPLPNARLRERR